MNRQTVLDRIAANRRSLRDLHVKSLELFGSVARGEAAEASDVDLLVEFEAGKPVGLFEFIRLKHFLEEILGCGVDLATEGALREEMKQRILKEAVRAT